MKCRTVILGAITAIVLGACAKHDRVLVQNNDIVTLEFMDGLTKPGSLTPEVSKRLEPMAKETCGSDVEFVNSYIIDLQMWKMHALYRCLG